MTNSNLKDCSSREESVLGALCYADIFDFPCKAEEIPTYLPMVAMTMGQIEICLHKLLSKGQIQRKGDYWFLKGRDEVVFKRQKRETQTLEKWSLLRKYLPKIIGLPWIKGILLTGSLAARNASKDDDADLFLILDHRRMWLGYLIIRLWLRRIKKINLCPNYAISDQSLKLVFPNLFTAIEWSMAVPLKDDGVLETMASNNDFFQRFIPNGKPVKQRRVNIEPRKTFLGSLMTLLLRSPLGALGDKLEFARLKWRTKGTYFPKKFVYKPHPPLRQYLILKAWLERLDRYGIELLEVRQHIYEQKSSLKAAMREWGISTSQVMATKTRKIQISSTDSLDNLPNLNA